jgi:hypothetical protein
MDRIKVARKDKQRTDLEGIGDHELNVHRTVLLTHDVELCRIEDYPLASILYVMGPPFEHGKGNLGSLGRRPRTDQASSSSIPCRSTSRTYRGAYRSVGLERNRPLRRFHTLGQGRGEVQLIDNNIVRKDVGQLSLQTKEEADDGKERRTMTESDERPERIEDDGRVDLAVVVQLAEVFDRSDPPLVVLENVRLSNQPNAASASERLKAIKPLERKARGRGRRLTSSPARMSSRTWSTTPVAKSDCQRASSYTKIASAPMLENFSAQTFVNVLCRSL